MTCLTIVQNACLRIGITSPSAVVTSQDQQVLQLLALLNEEGQSIAERTNWQALTTETSFTTVATEIQTALTTTAPGLRFVINDTIWNRTLKRPVYGPLGPQGWQAQKAMLFQGPWNQYRIVAGSIKFLPAPTAGQSCYFEYVSSNWCTDTTGVTGKSSFTVDSDIGKLDENLMTLGLIWRWKQQKGFGFMADFQKYDQQLRNALGRDASKPVLNLGGGFDGIEPVVLVSSGSWPL